MRRWLPRVLFGCRAGEHLWRRLYGDERMHRGARFACDWCGRRTDGPVAGHVDPAQDRVDDLKAWLGVSAGEPDPGRMVRLADGRWHDRLLDGDAQRDDGYA